MKMRIKAVVLTLVFVVGLAASHEAVAEPANSNEEFKAMVTCTQPSDYVWGTSVSRQDSELCTEAAKKRGIPVGQVAIYCISGPKIFIGKEKFPSLHFFYATWDASTKNCSRNSVLLINQKSPPLEIQNYHSFMDVIATALQFVGGERKRILDFLKFEYLGNGLRISLDHKPSQKTVVNLAGSILENSLKAFKKIELNDIIAIEPDLLKIGNKTSVSLRFRSYPSSSKEEFELIEGDPKNQVIAKIPRAQIQQAPEWQIAKLDLSLDKLGVHQLVLRTKGNDGWITSEPMEVDVVPVHVPTQPTGSDLSKIIKHPKLGEIISNVLSIQLKKGEGYARAIQLANSVDMKIEGYTQGRFWTLQFKDGGGVTKIDKAMKILKSSPSVVVVEPDHVGHIEGY